MPIGVRRSVSNFALVCGRQFERFEVLHQLVNIDPRGKSAADATGPRPKNMPSDHALPRQLDLHGRANAQLFTALGHKSRFGEIEYPQGNIAAIREAHEARKGEHKPRVAPINKIKRRAKTGWAARAWVRRL
jgi:hypothetical protein